MMEGILKRYWIVLLATAGVLGGCTSAQYGYDDVYDHEYPVYTASAKTDAPASYQDNNSNRDYSNYDTYEEEDYEYYGRNYGGSYSSRIDRFYGPSISISYYSGLYSPYYYGGYGTGFSFGYGYGYNPYSWYYDPYQYHMHYYHSPIYYGYNYYGYGYPSYYNPWYNPYYPCPTTYGYGYYDGYYPSANSVHYGPRPSYSGYDVINSNRNSYTISNPSTPNINTTIFNNGIRMNTTIKDNPAPANSGNVPGVNSAPKPIATPNSAPRPRRNEPRKQTIPKDYTAPSPASNPSAPKPRYNSQPKPTINTQPKQYTRPSTTPSYSQPRSTPSVKPSTKPTSKPRGSTDTPAGEGSSKAIVKANIVKD